MVIGGAWVLVCWNLFDHSFVTIMVSSIFIAVFSLVCRLMVFSSFCLTASMITLVLFAPRFGKVGKGESFSSLSISPRFFTPSVVGSIREERNWFEKRILNWETQPKMSAPKGKWPHRSCAVYTLFEYAYFSCSVSESMVEVFWIIPYQRDKTHSQHLEREQLQKAFTSYESLIVLPC